MHLWTEESLPSTWELPSSKTLHFKTLKRPERIIKIWSWEPDTENDCNLLDSITSINGNDVKDCRLGIPTDLFYRLLYFKIRAYYRQWQRCNKLNRWTEGAKVSNMHNTSGLITRLQFPTLTHHHQTCLQTFRGTGRTQRRQSLG
jgi:hypothetical protein